MTALAARRRRSTVIAAVLLVVASVLAVGIAAVGASSIVNSRAGRDAGADRLPVVRLPETPTGLVVVVDGDGRPTTMAMVVVAPGGVGGSIVPLPVTADSTLDLGADRFPLLETFDLGGIEAFVLEVEVMTALDYDVVEFVTEERLAELIAPLVEIEVDLPLELFDDDSGEPLLTAGRHELTPPEVAAALVARDLSRPDHVQDPARAAIWRGIAVAAGAGSGTVPAVGPDDPIPTVRDLDELVTRLLSGRVGYRSLVARVPDAERNPRGVDTVLLDRAEILLVVGQIAPARVAAPNESLTFRIEVSFDEAELAELGLNNADIARDVINRLLFFRANVVSVVTNGDSDDPVPDVSRVTVVELGVDERLDDLWVQLLGDLDVEPAAFVIPGVDATLRLGRSYLDLRLEELVAGVEPPGGLVEESELGPTDDDDRLGLNAPPDGLEPDETDLDSDARGGDDRSDDDDR